MSQLSKNAPLAAGAKLSVAVIVRDAADALRETLSSVQAIADEIVVTDTGSSDDSPSVARDFNAKVVETPWQGDFSAARNFCLSHVSGDWVLWLDAGETLSTGDAELVRETVNGAPASTSVYAILVEAPPQGPAAAAEQIARVRLFPKHAQIQFTGKVRESIDRAFVALSLTAQALPVCARRSGREHEPQVKEAKARRNIRIAEAEINDVGVQPRLLNCLGDAFQTLKDNARAAQFFRHAVQASESGSTDMLEAYYGIITSLDDDPRHHEEQLAVCVKAIEAFPTDAQLLCAMGGYLQRQGQTELAMKAYQTAYQFGQVNPGVWHVGCVHEIAAMCYSLTLQMLQRNEEALALLREATAKYPASTRLRRHVIELLIKLGKRDEALEEVTKLPREFPNRESLRSAVRGACLAAANNWIAAKAYLKTAYNAGSRDPICLRWYATTLISSGEIEEARPLVQEWIELEPTSSIAQQYWTALEASSSQDATDRQVRIDGADVQQSHLPTSPARTPAHSTSARAPRQQ